MEWVGIIVDSCGVVALLLIYKTFRDFAGPGPDHHGETAMSPDDVWEE
jgi:hypothetical protein